jgi:hypothetical protein
MRVLPYLFAGFLASVMVVLKTYEDLSKGRSIYMELRDLNGTIKQLENKGVVGMGNDTYSYLIPAYGYYKKLLPVVEVDGERYFASYRFLSSWVFVPFMWLFKGYFPLAYIIFFAFSVMLGPAYLMEGLHVKPQISIIIPRLLLEGPAVFLLILFLRLLLDKKYSLALLPLIFAGLIRGEISALCALYGLYLILKTKNFIYSVSAIPITAHAITSQYLGDQSSFYFWTYKIYVMNVLGRDFRMDEIHNCASEKLGFYPQKVSDNYHPYGFVHPYYKVYSQCFKEKVMEINLKKEGKLILLNVVKNFFRLIFLPKEEFSRLLKSPYLWFFVVYGIFVVCGIFWFLMFNSPLIPLLYLILVAIYSIYNPFGSIHSDRFKVVLIPFEVFFLGSWITKRRDIR